MRCTTRVGTLSTVQLVQRELGQHLRDLVMKPSAEMERVLLEQLRARGGCCKLTELGSALRQAKVKHQGSLKKCYATYPDSTVYGSCHHVSHLIFRSTIPLTRAKRFSTPVTWQYLHLLSHLLLPLLLSLLLPLLLHPFLLVRILLPFLLLLRPLLQLPHQCHPQRNSL